MEFIEKYFGGFKEVIEKVDKAEIEKVVDLLVGVKEQCGRVFCIGVGGGAANASHAVNDFRKICGIEAYAPTDNVAELTAWTNDKGWEYTFVKWLETSKMSSKDMVFVFSVGGGQRYRTQERCTYVSENIVYATRNVKEMYEGKVCGIVGGDGGYTKKYADACVLVHTVDSDMTTPYVESMQIVVLHLIVNHPKLRGKNW